MRNTHSAERTCSSRAVKPDSARMAWTLVTYVEPAMTCTQQSESGYPNSICCSKEAFRCALQARSSGSRPHDTQARTRERSRAHRAEGGAVVVGDVGPAGDVGRKDVLKLRV